MLPLNLKYIVKKKMNQVDSNQNSLIEVEVQSKKRKMNQFKILPRNLKVHSEKKLDQFVIF